MGFPCGSDGKESACNAGDLGSISGPGRSPGEGNGYPLWYSCLENSTDRGVWRATVHGVAKSQTQLSNLTLWLHFSAQNAPICWSIVPASLCHYNLVDVTTPFSVSPLCLVGLVTLSCDSLISMSQSLLGSVSTLRVSAVFYDFLHPQHSVSNLAWFRYSTTISYTYK